LPVYNGEAFLSAAIESILNQAYTDFELIISDNASTDATEEICRAFATHDPRIRYFRQSENLGAAPNYNFTFGKARGEYFKWAAHDDVHHPTLLEETVRGLDEHPEATLSYSRVRKINEHGEVIGTYDYLEDDLRIDDSSPHRRFSDMICVPHNCVAFFGLMRREQLALTPLHAAYEGSDRNLLAEMALRGPMHRVPEYLFDRRDHPNTYSRTRNKVRLRDRVEWWDTKQAGRIKFPTWKRAGEYAKSIRRVDLSTRERVACYAQLPRWLFGPRWYRQRWVHLLRDLANACLQLIGRRIQSGRASDN